MKFNNKELKILKELIKATQYADMTQSEKKLYKKIVVYINE